MRLLGKTYDALGQDGREWYRKACKEAPNTREPWVELAQSCYAKHDWSQCHSSVMKALEIKDKSLVYTMNPDVWGALPHDLAAISAYNLGLYDIALEQGKIALEFDASNERLKNNLIFYADGINSKQ